jgi:hypothetical protein
MRNCHAAENLEATATCKEMPVIPVNNVMDNRRIVGKRRSEEDEERHKGLLTKNSYEGGTSFSFILSMLQCYRRRSFCAVTLILSDICSFCV